MLFLTIFIWDVKLPLRLKVFLWLMLKRSILTKDNLIYRGWVGDKTCMFCGADESINHLFFFCPLSRYIWNYLCCTFGLPSPPVDIGQLFTVWVKKFARRPRKLVLFGLVAIFWTIWKVHNSACFQRNWPAKHVSAIHVICHWIIFGPNCRRRKSKSYLSGVLG